MSAKHQVTIPQEALLRAGLQVGDRLKAEVRAPGEVILTREADPIERFAGALTGVYGSGYLDDLRVAVAEVRAGVPGPAGASAPVEARY